MTAEDGKLIVELFLSRCKQLTLLPFHSPGMPTSGLVGTGSLL